uniref:Uncharacterized protein n=1 Tax=Hemiselmis andersenii TaxID=464988 RepID=A0A7S1DW53_HEMAN|mmetsp:Transcript_26731/g.64989  ORF Transcript_26731/g.64989 Transcript_26731/m.64989 type:complete len:191 (+) Transcript_26731:3-575(+)
MEGVEVRQLMAAQDSNACIDAEGGVWTWGRGQGYALGTGTEQDVLRPTQMGALQGFGVRELAVGDMHMLALMDTKSKPPPAVSSAVSSAASRAASRRNSAESTEELHSVGTQPFSVSSRERDSREASRESGSEERDPINHDLLASVSGHLGPVIAPTRPAPPPAGSGDGGADAGSQRRALVQSWSVLKLA